MNERVIGVRDLKTHLSTHLRRVKAGETILITERGHPIGRIVPLKAELGERLLGLVDAGIVSWNGSPLPVAPRQLSVRGERMVADLLLDDRG